ncbi:MAG TPA: hypothetical protein VFY04_02525 [Solirubrobacterales bacterium]|nr:hypothetical protein [Solirubrobacterales bacterium]
MSRRAHDPQKTPQSSEIGHLGRASDARRREERSLPMSERLARVDELSRQMSEIKGVAREH